MKDYEQFYSNGGFGYTKNIPRHKNWLFHNVFTEIYSKDTTLLDAGCGDGFWSFLLASRFNVTGADVSEAGIRSANKKKARQQIKNINFICCDALETEKKYDIIFCRAPSFLNMPSGDDRFVKNIQKMASLSKKEVIYIQATYKPYERWSNSSAFFDSRADTDYVNSKWYYHDPRVLENVFNTVGNGSVRHVDNYIVGRIKK